MTWGVTASKKENEQAKTVAGQVPDFQNGAVKREAAEPQNLFASKQAYICAGMMLICGLLTIIGGICQEFAIYRLWGKFYGWSIWTGVLFTITGTCAVLACNKQSKPRLVSASAFSILTIITAIVVIIFFGFCVAKGVNMQHRMMEMKERQWREEFRERFDKFGWRHLKAGKGGGSDESGEHERPHGRKPLHHHQWPCKTKRPGPRPTGSPSPRPTPTGHPWPRPPDHHWPKPPGHYWPRPTDRPSPRPTGRPSPRPTGRPSPRPTGRPSPRPTGRPSPRPTGRPAPRPTGHQWPRPSARPWPKPRRPTGHPWPRPPGRPWPKPNGRPMPTRLPWLDSTPSRKDGQRNNDYSKFTHGWQPMMMFVASLVMVTLVLIELVNAIILTIYSVRSLRAGKYALVHEKVVVRVPLDDKTALANIDDLPKIK